MGENFNLNELNLSQLDFFRELENIGASHAATALSVMLNEAITLRVPRVQFCEFNDICGILNGPETLVVGILVEISGDISGFILLVQDANDGKQLAKMLTSAMGVEEEDAPPEEFFHGAPTLCDAGGCKYTVRLLRYGHININRHFYQLLRTEDGDRYGRSSHEFACYCLWTVWRLRPVPGNGILRQ